MRRLLIATSNSGKLRDFAGAAEIHRIEIAGIPNFKSLPEVAEDAETFEGNARKKAEIHSRAVPGQLVLADDSGLEVAALNGAPGVHSARYASGPGHPNSTDVENNAKLLRELSRVPDAQRQAKFVCVIAVAREGKTLVTTRGEAHGLILDAPRGASGFGYDPLFLFPGLNKSFAELSPQEKARVSHRGQAFRKVLEWLDTRTNI